MQKYLTFNLLLRSAGTNPRPKLWTELQSPLLLLFDKQPTNTTMVEIKSIENLYLNLITTIGQSVS